MKYHLDNGFTPQVITGVTLASVFVLVGVLLILGFLVYTIAIRTKMKTNRWYCIIIVTVQHSMHSLANHIWQALLYIYPKREKESDRS